MRIFPPSPKDGSPKERYASSRGGVQPAAAVGSRRGAVRLRQSARLPANALGRGSVARRVAPRLRVGLGTPELPPPLRCRGDPHLRGALAGQSAPSLQP